MCPLRSWCPGGTKAAKTLITKNSFVRGNEKGAREGGGSTKLSCKHDLSEWEEGRGRSSILDHSLRKYGQGHWGVWAKVGRQGSPWLLGQVYRIFLPLSAIGSEAVCGKHGLTANEEMDLRAHTGFRVELGAWVNYCAARSCSLEGAFRQAELSYLTFTSPMTWRMTAPICTTSWPTIWQRPVHLWTDRWVLVRKGTSASFNDLLSVTLVKAISTITIV